MAKRRVRADSVKVGDILHWDGFSRRIESVGKEGEFRSLDMSNRSVWLNRADIVTVER